MRLFLEKKPSSMRLEVNKRNAAGQVLEDAKEGRKVKLGATQNPFLRARSQSRIKDLRDRVEVVTTTAVLDGRAHQISFWRCGRPH